MADESENPYAPVFFTKFFCSEHVATISKKKTFGLSMVTDATQLFVGDTNADLLPPDQAKIFLQGGIFQKVC